MRFRIWVFGGNGEVPWTAMSADPIVELRRTTISLGVTAHTPEIHHPHCTGATREEAIENLKRTIGHRLGGLLAHGVEMEQEEIEVEVGVRVTPAPWARDKGGDG